MKPDAQKKRAGRKRERKERRETEREGAKAQTRLCAEQRGVEGKNGKGKRKKKQCGMQSPKGAQAESSIRTLRPFSPKPQRNADEKGGKRRGARHGGKRRCGRTMRRTDGTKSRKETAYANARRRKSGGAFRTLRARRPLRAFSKNAFLKRPLRQRRGQISCPAAILSRSTRSSSATVARISSSTS